MIATDRIHSHCLFSGDESGTPVIFLHGNMSAATFYEELMADMPAQYWCIAPDMRGYGDTQDLSIDATRGAGDLVDDLRSLYQSLGIESAHLVGWSAGAGVIMQFALKHASRVDSLCLIAPVSPFGFGGTTDIDGTPTSRDFAGSGAGTVSAEVIEQLHQKNTGPSPATSPRQVLRNFFVNPGTVIKREDTLVDAMLKQKLGEKRYPGDHLASSHPLQVAPGIWGPINALSPRYFNTSALADLPVKPPILWVRGSNDKVISDQSLFDLATTLQQEPSLEDGTSAAPVISSQPMIGQMRDMLSRYQEDGGHFEEVVMKDVGHTPFLEKQDDFLRVFSEFLSNV